MTTYPPQYLLVMEIRELGREMVKLDTASRDAQLRHLWETAGELLARRLEIQARRSDLLVEHVQYRKTHR